jgi:hypothetical protein
MRLAMVNAAIETILPCALCIALEDRSQERCRHENTVKNRSRPIDLTRMTVAAGGPKIYRPQLLRVNLGTRFPANIQLFLVLRKAPRGAV